MPLYQPLLPVFVLVCTLVQGARLKAKARFRLRPHPLWPESENPGLAVELAPSKEFADSVLGDAGTATGDANRAAMIAVQHQDWIFIPLYVAFFIAVAWSNPLNAALRWAITALAALTGAADYLEDAAIIGLAKGAAARPRPFGQLKWILYFITVLAEIPVFFEYPSVGPIEWGVLAAFAGAVALSSIWGIWSGLRAGYSGIAAASKLSAFGVAGLAAAPFIENPPVSLHIFAEYAALMRVPLLVGAVLIALPALAFFVGATSSLLKGLFDVSPRSLLMLTLAAAAAGGTVADNMRIIYVHAADRFAGVTPVAEPAGAVWLWITLGTSLPIIATAWIFSLKQKYSPVWLTAAVVSGLGLTVVTVKRLELHGAEITRMLLNAPFEKSLTDLLVRTGLFAGYVTKLGSPTFASDIWEDHLTAAAAFGITFALYAGLGVYGWTRLGKRGTVPALSAALMLIMMICWMLSATSFFFDEWRVPVLSIVILAGAITAQSGHSDHYYGLRRRESSRQPPGPAETILAAGRSRVIVVAANGGGIQAGAWAAQVLQGLHESCDPDFGQSVRLISSVSGGSLGSACYVYWLAEPDLARDPADSAAESSIDEVAWGLGWPDFLRALCPWAFFWAIGRGRALEKAWCLNGARDPNRGSRLDSPLSDWNERVATGELPGVVMNATISETGERLLMSTTQFTGHGHGRARVDADKLHNINGQALDVAVVTAARLSASFPYVTPAARSNGPGPQPHVVDGGYYDNYGMATLTEWLDEALTGAEGRIESVLVIQIHGAPVETNQREKRHSQSRGWFYQAIAPLSTMAAVRSAGQIAHNDIELGLLQEKWAAKNVPIESVLFQFPYKDAPLSWHLTDADKQRIRDAWDRDMGPCRTVVSDFLRCDGKSAAAR